MYSGTECRYDIPQHMQEAEIMKEKIHRCGPRTLTADVCEAKLAEILLVMKFALSGRILK